MCSYEFNVNIPPRHFEGQTCSRAYHVKALFLFLFRNSNNINNECHTISIAFFNHSNIIETSNTWKGQNWDLQYINLSSNFLDTPLISFAQETSILIGYPVWWQIIQRCTILLGHPKTHHVLYTKWGHIYVYYSSTLQHLKKIPRHLLSY